MSGGPYLYDDGPEPLHTGAPRRRPVLLLGILGGTVAVAVGMAVTLPLVAGSPAEQAREVSEVFARALAAGDRETAGDLLCQAERVRLGAQDLAVSYPVAGGEVTGVAAGERDGATAQRVAVSTPDGGTATLTVVNEDGARICGIASGG